MRGWSPPRCGKASDGPGRAKRRAVAAAALFGSAALLIGLAGADRSIEPVSLDVRLWRVLKQAGFTGRVQSTLEARLGRPIDPALAAIGNQLFFDPILSPSTDNACAGCHSPAHGFGDSQSIAIGVRNNGIVGAGRRGPRNQRRSPMVLNSAFYPKLMWNGRFRSLSGDPFQNSQGFAFPPPEATARFPAARPERFPSACRPGSSFHPRNWSRWRGSRGWADRSTTGSGIRVPPPDASGFRNEPIRKAVLDARQRGARVSGGIRGRLRRAWRRATGSRSPCSAAAIAEFEFTLTFADAPVDRFMRGDHAAMTDEPEARRPPLFRTRRAACGATAVSGGSNEMFSDFEMHVVAIPQIAPAFGPGTRQRAVRRPGRGRGLRPRGRHGRSGRPLQVPHFAAAQRRASADVLPQRRLHEPGGRDLATTTIPRSRLASTTRWPDGLAPDLAARLGPIEPVIARLSPLLTRSRLAPRELLDLIAFVRDGLLDPRATPENLLQRVPAELPSGLPGLVFESPSP